MASNNFDLAPPPKTVDGLLAVPIDIQGITAKLTFDGATESGSGEATLNFIMGPHNGNPIFDLRQTVLSAWLDGTPFPVAQLAHHDFGGGSDAELRIVQSVLAADSGHTLRVTYELGLPQASTAGSYQPQLTWSRGPRLTFNFGFTDLGAGRYLEAWIPANLIFDQFELALELQILNTSIHHMLITNGSVTELGMNHWSIIFPSRFTALSPLLELRASDTLTNMTGTTTLPVSGQVVTIEASKLATSSIDLGGQINSLNAWLAANENSIGPYMHGSRFVAFLHFGGMEYEGGTTSGAGPLQHETYHSWWGRGVKPGTQNDAWWDEAWTVYVTSGFGPAPFNFANTPVELFLQNPWIRRTHPDSYISGRMFFQGVASTVGDNALRNFMSQFYEGHLNRPVTTLELESFLLCKSGETGLVDAFHRFVYGFADPVTTPNLWMRDDPTHTGAELWEGRFWDSPDLWIRNADDGLSGHQNPIEGRDNWFYARVRNEGGIARHFMVTFNVKQFAGTQFVYQDDFLPCIAATGGFELAPGESRIVKAKWLAPLVPPAGTHGCLLAAALARADHPVGGRHVWEDNNLAQKNLTVVELDPNDWVVIPIVIGNWFTRSRSVTLEFVRPRGFSRMRASILHPVGLEQIIDEKELLDCGGEESLRERTVPLEIWTNKSGPVWAERYFFKAQERRLPVGRVARCKVASKTGFPIVLGIRLEVPQNAKPGISLLVDLVQRDQKERIVGGIAVQINIRRTVP